jgi:hypothetical protein
MDISGREQITAPVEDLAQGPLAKWSPSASAASFKGGRERGAPIADKESLVQRILNKIRPE